MSADHGDQYRNAIGVLADDAKMAPTSVARLERELLDAFTEHHSAVTPARTAWRRDEWRPWVAAAAAIIAIAASIEVWRFHPVVTVNNVTQPAGRENPPVAPPGSSSTGPHAGALSVSPVSIPARQTPSVRGAGARRGVVKPAGFVELPNAAGLPEFESGTIVRLELPVASLPAYGIEIPGAADERPVEADLLVGQDGAVRAIRLVARPNDATGARDSHGKQE
jgi:hypothetical protein